MKHSPEAFAVPDHICPAVRLFLTEQELLAQVGFPHEHRASFPVPCPKPLGDADSHRCFMRVRSSFFQCTCGESGQYWDYAAKLLGISCEDALDRVLKRMEVESLSEVRYPWDGQTWYEKKLASLWHGTGLPALPSITSLEREPIGPVMTCPQFMYQPL